MPSAFWIVTPSTARDAQLAIAAARAGEIGIFDLGCTPSGATQAASHEIAAVAALAQHAGCDRWGVRVEALGESSDPLSVIQSLGVPGKLPLLVLAGLADEPSVWNELRARAGQLADRVYLEVYRLAEADAAQQAGFDGLVVKGNEAAGRVSHDSSFLLLQQFHGRINIPYVIQGGIGADTAAAAFLAGAAGVVLREQVWLTREAPFDDSLRKRFAALDGSETVTVSDRDHAYRFFGRVGRPALARIERLIAQGESCRQAVASVIKEQPVTPTLDGVDEALFPLGQDIAFASHLAERHETVSGLLQAMRRRVAANLRLARQQRALASRAPLAQAHGTKYPILQGPMTRVSDVTPFCRSVADNGALPFLALALLRGSEVRQLLTETKASLGKLPWGVGILGFVPAALRKEQLEVVREIRPSYAIIAGGRPSQAQQLEELGICTYLHVPSPGLLASFLADGARKFIFEGRECGGHVGPRSSFTLWQSAIDVLLHSDLEKPEQVHVVFAGGIHNSLSAAMVASLAAPLVARGMKIGVLMGTAYLFTAEGVASGAITEEFQRQALECRETILLESGVGHATRCVPSPFADEFISAKHELVRDGADSDQIRTQLELLNIGRLRLAAKGIDRHPTAEPGGKGDLRHVDAATQRDKGMFMIGQVATLRDRVLTMAELHTEVSTGGCECLDRLADSCPAIAVARPRPGRDEQDIAIVGIACLFPKSRNLREYWQNIVRGFNAIREVPATRWRPADFYSADRTAPDKVNSKWGGFLEDVVFDPLKYVMPPSSVASIEPIQLLALEVAWQALEDAGYHGDEFCGDRTAVIFGVSPMHDRGAEYAFRVMAPHFLPRVEWLSDVDRERLIASLSEMLPPWTEDSFAGYLPNVIAGRVSNRLNLRGSNFAVDAACAASLAALQSAVRELRSHNCDVAVAGAADGTNNPFTFMSFAKTHALTSSGQPRPFDDTADGIALGEGVAALVLKRLVDAEREGDQIYAVIKGIGTSSDGRNRSLTAPHPEGQMSALERAYEDAGFDPKTVSLVEAHGTGTAVGDRTEIEALQRVFSAHGAARQSCGIGSVKSMIGHTKTAAGMASLIKTALALKHRLLPPTLGVTVPNRQIDFVHSPFYISSEARPWIDRNDAPARRAGLSAFGFGGTNFHVVLEEYTGQCHPRHEFDLAPRDAELLVWKRSEPAQLVAALEAFQRELAITEHLDLAALGRALAFDESHLGKDGSCRLAIVATSIEDLGQKIVQAIAQITKSETFNHPAGIYYSAAPPVSAEAVCFLFPGQGSQSVGMLQELALAMPDLLDVFDQADEVLKDVLPKPLSRYIYPVPTFDAESRARLAAELNDTRVAQPALAAAGLFGAKLLARFGLAPAALAGHSFGEYVALCAGGAFSERELLRLAAERGRVVHESTQSAPGAMAAVSADATMTAQAIESLGLALELANLNSPDQTIIAGPIADIDAAVKKLSAAGLRTKKIPVTGAFHTPAMAPAAAKLAESLGTINFQSLRIPVWSNTTAATYPEGAADARDLLTRHLTTAVLFETEVRKLHDAGLRIFLEVGPGAVLTGLVGRILRDRPHTAIALDSAGRKGFLQLAHLLAQCVAMGLPVNVSAWFAKRRLPALGVAKLCARTRQEQVRKPTDWVINGGQSRPYIPTKSENGKPRTVDVTNQKIHPLERVEQSVARSYNGLRTGKPAGSTSQSPGSPVAVTASTAVIGSTYNGISNSMSAHQDNPSDSNLPERALHGTPLAAAAPAQSPVALEALAYFQNTMTQWLELQKSQHSANQQFLATQERVLLAFMQAAPAVGQSTPSRPPVMAPPAMAPSSIARAPRQAAPVTPLRVAPAPGLAMARPHEPLAGAVPYPGSPAPAAIHAAPQRQSAVLQRQAVAVQSSANGDSSAGASGHHGVPVAAAAIGGPPTTDQFRRDLLETVTLRTGYPLEMLNLDLPLEAGLGIDSIKTLEIFNALKQYHAYFRDDEQQDLDEVLAEFTQLKTLGKLVDAYDLKRQRFVQVSPVAKPPASQKSHDGVSQNDADHAASSPSAMVERFEVAAVLTPLDPESREKKNCPTDTPS
jgi:acyl transferase domain-containing protein/NAD(P)H-dependent flavin oxidoreductase YrpB (nitropropane dioxygenase family)